MFIKDKVTQQVIDEDLNSLLPAKEFKKIRKFVKQEILLFIDEQVGELG